MCMLAAEGARVARDGTVTLAAGAAAQTANTAAQNRKHCCADRKHCCADRKHCCADRPAQPLRRRRPAAVRRTPNRRALRPCAAARRSPRIHPGRPLSVRRRMHPRRRLRRCRCRTRARPRPPPQAARRERNRPRRAASRRLGGGALSAFPLRLLDAALRDATVVEFPGAEQAPARAAEEDLTFWADDLILAMAAEQGGAQ